MAVVIVILGCRSGACFAVGQRHSNVLSNAFLVEQIQRQVHKNSQVTDLTGLQVKDF